MIIWPDFLVKNITQAGQALINKVDGYIQTLLSETNEVKDAFDPLRCHVSLINYLGESVHAEIKAGDSLREKRVKAYTAIEKGKNKSLFDGDLKLRVELITIHEVFLYSRMTDPTLEDAIFWSGNETRDRLWSIFGTTGAPGVTARGELFVSGSTSIPYVEDFLPGHILIDLTESKTSLVLDNIIEQININGGYVGHRIFLGYLFGSVFTVEAEA